MHLVTLERRAKGGEKRGMHLSGGRKFQAKRIAGRKALRQERKGGLEKQ